MPRISGDKAERFFAKVRKTRSCWFWIGQVSNKPGFSYGIFWLSHSEYILAHRWSYAFHIGPIPTGLKVLHKCDNPPCVNPKHLWAGTNKQNTADMIRKGRQNSLRLHGANGKFISGVVR